MSSFEIEYPVVGSVRLSRSDAAQQSLEIADTYFEPLMEAVLRLYSKRSTSSDSPPQLLKMWQEQVDAFDVEGGIHTFEPSDGLLPLLEDLGTNLPVIDTSVLRTPDGSPASTLNDVRHAMMTFLRDAISSGSTLQVEDVP